MMSNDRYTSANRVVIVGGGFAGVTLAQRLEGLVAASTEQLARPSNWLTISPMF
jgi:NADH dehydrogenase FAD-containing subunit